MSVLFLSCILLGASVDKVETHVHVIDQVSGEPVSSVEVKIGGAYYGTSDERGHVCRKVDPRGYVIDGNTPSRTFAIEIVSSQYQMVDQHQSMRWESDADLKKGYVILVTRKDIGARQLGVTETCYSEYYNPCVNVCCPRPMCCPQCGYSGYSIAPRSPVYYYYAPRWF